MGPAEQLAPPIGDIGSDLGTKMTEAKESSESTLVSDCRLLSFEESELSSFECRLYSYKSISFKLYKCN